MQQVSLEDAKVNLPHLIEEAVKGDDVFITQNGQPVVQLVPVVKGKRRPQFGSAKGLVRIAADFDEPLEDFQEYKA